MVRTRAVPARLRPALGGLALLSVLAACTAAEDAGQPGSSSTGTPSASSGSAATPPIDPEPTEPTEPETSEPEAQDPRFDARAAMGDVRWLAGEVGPRLATAPAFREAGRGVVRRLRTHGYDVRRQWFPVESGDSWGVPVQAGRSFNVIATPPGFRPARPHRLVGAHLDTVAVAPGAEDNASGVAVVLELARLASLTAPALPTVFVLYGAEEPRGPADDEHHYGSQHHVATLAAAQGRALRAMVSIDRVGVGTEVPVCTAPGAAPATRDRMLRLARRAEVPAEACENTTSDHWSYAKAGFPVARLGSTSYEAYHSERDLPRVVQRAQLARTGRIAWAWLTSRGA